MKDIEYALVSNLAKLRLARSCINSTIPVKKTLLSKWQAKCLKDLDFIIGEFEAEVDKLMESSNE